MGKYTINLIKKIKLKGQNQPKILKKNILIPKLVMIYLVKLKKKN